jgi:hypothetical protein
VVYFPQVYPPNPVYGFPLSHKCMWL